MSDPLARWFVHTVTVCRKTGDGAYGPVLGTGATESAFVDHAARDVRTPDGATTTSATRVFLPATAELVPLESTVTLPAEMGGATFSVTATAVRTALAGMPAHIELTLL